MSLNTGSLDFESGTTDYLDSANTTLTDGLATMTVECWVKPESLTAAMTFLQKGTTTQVWTFEYIQASDKIYVEVANFSKTASSAAGQLASGSWQHLAMVYNGGLADADKVVLYKNGSALATSVDASFPTTMGSQNLPLLVGKSSSSQPYDGLMDEVRIWNTARSAAQISANYQTELTGSETGLIFYSKFNEGTGTTTADATSGGLTLTLRNSTAWSAVVPFVGSSGTGGGGGSFLINFLG